MEIPAARREALKHALRPIVSFCVRRSLMLQDIIDVLKPLFVEESSSYLRLKGSKVNVNRVSIATGVHRTDVKAILRDGEMPSRTPSLLWRVIGQWTADRRFMTASGKPRVLPFDAEKINFCNLCLSVSRFLHPKTVLGELVRKGAVRESPKGIHLLVAEEKVGDSIERRWDLLESIIEDALVAVEQNSKPQFSPRNLLGRTEFDTVDPSKLSVIRAWILAEGKRFHARIRRFVSTFDYELSARSTTPGQRAPARFSVSTVSVSVSSSVEESRTSSFDEGSFSVS